MPPRRRSTPTPIDVGDLRSRLDQGKIVRVAVANSAQFPTGSIGRVRRIGDPAVDGAEFIHVELTVNGAKDVLPFAPGDLTVPGQSPAVIRTSVPTTTTGTAAASPDLPDPAPRPEAVRAKPPARPAAKRRGSAVAISVGTTDADPPQWRIEARVGSKVVLRNGSVPPARVWELVGMLGDESLIRAVGSVLDEQRQAAQSRADALAAELARVRAELAELPSPTAADRT